MKKVLSMVFAVSMGLSIFFTGNLAVQGETPFANPTGQIVPETKRISRKVYRKGRWVTVTTWKNGKRITKKVWRKGYWVGRKVGRKTKDIIMGPSRRTP